MNTITNKLGRVRSCETPQQQRLFAIWHGCSQRAIDCCVLAVHAQAMAPQLQLAVSEAAAGSSDIDGRNAAARRLEAAHAQVYSCTWRGSVFGAR